jgi:hypothetical protein
MTLNITVPEELAAQLPSDTDIADCEVCRLGDLRAEHTIHTDYYHDSPDDTVVVLLPGWYADDGSAEVEYSDAEDGEEAAQAYVDDGDWGDGSKTAWVTVSAWRRGYAMDDDDEVIEMDIDRDGHTIAIEAEEPDCEDDEDHDWQSPLSVVGGIADNPGVWGHGGGVVITEVCSHCGRYRVTDTWAQDMSNGRQGLRSVEYRDADDVSLGWIGDHDA